VSNYAAAKLAYTEASVMTATPERLVVMLYDGAIRFLTQAAAGVRAGRRDVTRAKLRSAQAIIDELNRSLDMRQGEVAYNLRAVYTFCSRHMIESTLNADPAGYEKVAELLAGLRESWDAIASGQAQVPAERLSA
jgi:flagellar secretion chaperone FliS